MKKTFLKWIAFTAIISLLAACNGVGTNNPKQVVEDFGTAMKNKDIDGAAKYCTRESQTTISMLKVGLEMAKKFGKGQEGTDELFKEWEKKNGALGEATITGDNATVPILVDGKEKQKIPLKKEDGKWKIDLTIGSFIQSNNEHMNKDNGVSEQDIKQMQESLQNISADSLKAIMEQAQKAAEELKKQLPETKQ